MMTKDYQDLRQEAYEANMMIVDAGLVLLTWGNASAVDRDNGVMAIKPSGIDYRSLTANDMVLLDLETGHPIEKDGMRPSSDSPTHLHLYRAFENIGGVVHTHSKYATIWAQAGKDIPCLGTTHADYFLGPIPVTRPMSNPEIKSDYEKNTAVVISERFEDIDPLQIASVLVHGHGPFCWGRSAAAAAENAMVLENIAEMAWASLLLAPEALALPGALLDKHFFRKHGDGAYYGQARP